MHEIEAKLKRAILNPDEEVAIVAVRYFNDSFSSDETVMPLVLDAFVRAESQHRQDLAQYHSMDSSTDSDWDGETADEYDDALAAPEKPAPIRREPRVGRNDPCPCGSGSGKKFKKCCMNKTPA